MHNVICGFLCRRRAIPFMDVFFQARSCLYSFPSLSFCFLFLLLFLFIQGLTRGHCLGMVTRVDSVIHKYFHRYEKVGS
jgi:hypothetical protein